MKLFFTVTLLLLMLCPACKDEPSVSQIPEISFQSAALYKNIKGNDSMIILTINYKDGDGDLGLSSSDTFPPYTYGSQGFYNLHVTYRVKNGSQWEAVINPGTLDTIHYNQRFPHLNLTDKDRAVSGTMDLRIPATPYPGIKPNTVKFILQMMDRRLNKSNSAETNDINLKH